MENEQEKKRKINQLRCFCQSQVDRFAEGYQPLHFVFNTPSRWFSVQIVCYILIIKDDEEGAFNQFLIKWFANHVQQT
jgi:hypothetical protein